MSRYFASRSVAELEEARADDCFFFCSIPCFFGTRSCSHDVKIAILFFMKVLQAFKVSKE